MSGCSAFQEHMERALSARNLFHMAFFDLDRYRALYYKAERWIVAEKT